MIMEHKIDFKELLGVFQTMSEKGKVTLLRQLIGILTPSACRTVLRYACIRLDAINSKLPEGHPGRERYKLYNTMRKQKLKN